MRKSLLAWSLFFGLVVGALVLGCAVNPVTGKKQLMLISEDQEIQMGKEYDPQVVASIGLYADDKLQQYVSGLGLPMAARSERPQLPWSFKVVDDPVVNAFAVPGGFIYVTRGILATLNSEAELVGVVGHEIGHVTARHTATQMSRQQLENLGLGLGVALSKDLEPYAGIVAAGLQVLNLKYSRGDESQADELGLRYMSGVNYDPHALVDVFKSLALVSGGSDQRLPEWQLTHPYPENREQRINDLIAASGKDYKGFEINRDDYLDRINGIVYGADPREGFFKGSVFHHPGLAFRVDFPEGWKGVNEKSAVAALSPAQDALVVVSMAEEKSPDAALSAFLSQQGIQPGTARRDKVNGLQAARAPFTATTQDGVLQGEALFVSHGENVFRLLGYTAQKDWSRYAAPIQNSLGTFRRETDQAVLNAKPAHLEIVTLPKAMTFEDFLSKHPSSVSAEEVALINRVQTGERLEAGRRMKRVVGGELP